LLVLAPLSLGAAQNPSSIRTVADLEKLTTNYYRQPNPGLVTQAIAFIGATRLPENAAPPITGFFSEVFRDNPDRMVEWKAAIAELNSVTRSFFGTVVGLSEQGGVLSLKDQSAAMNDMCWGAFFATGRAEFVDRIVDRVKDFDERNDQQVFLVGATALWSLSSNAQIHDRVRTALETSKAQRDARTATLVAELLAQGPARIGERARDIIVAQRAAGKWK
jgi:hypothetical protein